MRLHKKTLCTALLSALVLSIPMTSAFAANTVITAGNDWVGSDYVDAGNVGTAITTKKTITVTNIHDRNDGVTNNKTIKVVAYQIVKGTYDNNKLTNYVLCDPTNTAITDLAAPTATEITTIADSIRANTTTLTGIEMTEGTSGTYTADVEAGLYVVIVSDANGYVYNPALVAVNISDADNIVTSASGTTVDMSTYFNVPANAYLKSTTTAFNKDIVGTGTPKNSEGDITAKGDTINFKIDNMIIPDYTTYGNNLVFKLEDKLEANSFAGISNMLIKTYEGFYDDDNDASTPDVKKNEQIIAPETVDDKGTVDTSDDETITNYTIVYKDSNGETVTGADIAKSATEYTIQFTTDWLKANAANNVEITYSTVLSDTAKVNGSANRTAAALSYTVDPTNSNNVEVLRDSTYHYTFEIGGQIDANAQGDTTTGKVNDKKSFRSVEINKVSQTSNSLTEYQIDTTTGEYKSAYALDGATFTLYDNEACTTIHTLKTRDATTGAWSTENAVYTTEADGRIVFTGLDEGTYYLKETEAPDGYTINENVFKVVITGIISDGTTVDAGALTGYTIEMFTKNGNVWVSAGSTVCAIAPTITTPTTDATATDFDTVVNTTTATINPAEIVDTVLIALPSTGGVGTILITVSAALGMGIFLSIYLVNKKRKISEN